MAVPCSSNGKARRLPRRAILSQPFAAEGERGRPLCFPFLPLGATGQGRGRPEQQEQDGMHAM